MTIKEEELAKGNFADDPDVYMASVAIGLQRVLGQAPGKRLLQLAEQQIEEGISKLLTIDPEQDMKAYKLLRNEVLVAQQALTWINTILVDGALAEQKIKDEDAGQ